MKFYKFVFIFAALQWTACGSNPKLSESGSGQNSGALKQLTFLATNDVHGHIEANVAPDGSKKGGLEMLASIVGAFREKTSTDANRALFLVDGGDQFQGTLLSNINEGALLFKIFDQIGYDAVVPGNHDYDFGPIDWKNDRVVKGVTSKNPREVIEMLSKSVRFPLISANTYFKTSVSEQIYGGKVTDQCKPAQLNASGPVIDFMFARRPSFLKPYTIVKKQVCG